MLTKMLLRDLWHLRGQVMAAALVVACGIGALVATRGTYQSLLVARADYYAANRFADVFARLKRAPESLADDIRRVSGVAQVRTRIVVEVTLDVPGLDEPAIGRVVSIPERRAPMLNDLQLVRGNYVAPGSTDQVLVSEAFATANGLEVGARIGAVLNGRWKELAIAGIALSPEFIYEVGSGMLFPDNKRFGVLWMAREAMGPAFDMEGAFNDVAVSLSAGAREQDVIAALDVLLQRYGGPERLWPQRPALESFPVRRTGRDRHHDHVHSRTVPCRRLVPSVRRAVTTGGNATDGNRPAQGLWPLEPAGGPALPVPRDGDRRHRPARRAAAGGLPGWGVCRCLQGLLPLPGSAPRRQRAPGADSAAVSMLAAAVGALVAVRRAVALAPAEAMRPERACQLPRGPDGVGRRDAPLCLPRCE